ncbi:MAG TPA: formate dehydrogenase accessory sulfurtransferase FdhD [Candidatus Latescibacteria bacterium]|nr:formate dehydrogenase accessory sulfurtransferase FdhD [Candidatus Latescibacterota bacterium]
MGNEVEKFPIVRFEGGKRADIVDEVVRESFLTVFLNDQELVTLLCTPDSLKCLAVGFLFSEGLLKDLADIKKIIVDDQRGVVWVETNEVVDSLTRLTFKRVITSGCGRGTGFYNVADFKIRKVTSPIRVTSEEILDLMFAMQDRSRLYRDTGGVHSAALCNRQEILLFNEDIGRHNAVDKILGEAILQGIPTGDKMLLTSGRISSEILLKAARRGIPVIVSRAAPTDAAVRLAIELGITLIGFARGKKMNVYTNTPRVE